MIRRTLPQGATPRYAPPVGPPNRSQRPPQSTAMPQALAAYPPEADDVGLPVLARTLPNYGQALLSLGPQREQLKNDYCALMLELNRHPLVLAIRGELRSGSAPKQEYRLYYGLKINRTWGLVAETNPGSCLDSQDMRRISADAFVPSSTLGGFPGLAVARSHIENRLQDISREITTAYSGAARARGVR